MSDLASPLLVKPPESIMARKTAAALKKFSGHEATWMVAGFDVSMSSIAGAAMMFDGLLDKMRGPALVMHRWERDIHYFDRLNDASRPENFIFALMSELKGAVIDPDQLFIAVEEPWPMGIVKRAQSGWIKQQAQVQGVFMGGLIRYGWRNVFEVNSQSWKGVIARELGVKVHKDFKWDVKKWAIDTYGVENFPDIIESSKGKIPKPPNSKAKPIQPDDRYDAIGLCNWMENQYLEGKDGNAED